MPGSPEIARLPASGFRRTPWKNGGGTTVDIADRYLPGAEAGGWSGMVWRFGRTRIERPAPFSDLAGQDRILVVVEGRGLTLRVDDGRVLDAREPFRPIRFAGDWPITSALEAGPVGVLNLMGDRSQVVLNLDIVTHGRLDVAAGETVVYAFGDAASLGIGAEEVALAAGDAVRFAATQSVRVTCAGTVAVAAIRSRDGRPAS